MTDYNELKKLAEAVLQPQGNLCEPEKWVLDNLRNKREYDIAANPATVLQMIAHIAELEQQNKALHIKLAGETLRADKGWERYEHSNKSHMAALDLLSKK